MTKHKAALLAALAAAAAAFLFGGLIGGWDGGTLLIAAGCGLGGFLGVHWGNRKARETDAYRQEWLGKRKKRGEQSHQ